jgi:hypothetical protein
MRTFGPNFSGARVLGAICGLLTAAILTWTGVRLLAGGPGLWPG